MIIDIKSNKDVEKEQAVQAAIKARDEFIASLPPERKADAEELQAKIDLALKKAGNANNRLTIIYGMMMDAFYELNGHLQSLRNIDTPKPKLKVIK